MRNNWCVTNKTVWPEYDLKPKFYQRVEMLEAPEMNDLNKPKWIIPPIGIFSSEDDLVSVVISYSQWGDYKRRIMRRGEAYAIMRSENEELQKKRDLLERLEWPKLNKSTGEWREDAYSTPLLWDPDCCNGPQHPHVYEEWKRLGYSAWETKENQRRMLEEEKRRVKEEQQALYQEQLRGVRDNGSFRGKEYAQFSKEELANLHPSIVNLMREKADQWERAYLESRKPEVIAKKLKEKQEQQEKLALESKKRKEEEEKKRREAEEKSNPKYYYSPRYNKALWDAGYIYDLQGGGYMGTR